MLLLGFGTKLCLERRRQTVILEAPAAISAGEAIVFEGPGVRHVRLGGRVDPAVTLFRLAADGNVSFATRDLRARHRSDNADLTTWFPVEGLGYRLWVVSPDGRAPAGESIEGILEIIDPHDLGAMLGVLRAATGANVPRPTQARAIVLATPAEYRRLRKLPPTWHRLGLWCLGAGTILLVVFGLRVRAMLR